MRKAQYSIHFRDDDGNLCSVDWRWPDEKEAVWTMSSKELGSTCTNWMKGPLNDRGTQEVFRHFGLEKKAEELPIEMLSGLSPLTLLGIRRQLEAEDKTLPVLNPVSDHHDQHVRAAEAA